MPPTYMRDPCRGRCRQGGFTLIELMVTISVFAILVSIAVPSFTSSIQQTQAMSASDAFHRLVANARVLASQKGKKITLSVSDSKSLNTSSWTDGCGNAVWAVSEVDPDDSTKTKAISCLSGADFDKRYKATTVALTGNGRITYQPTGVASNEKITVSFTQGAKTSTVTILPGGTANVASN